MSKPVLDHRQVMEILPHRAPMLLLDEVTLLQPMKRIEASLWLDPDWDVFRGHFPGNPVFPGVLAVECMMQAADIMIMTDGKYAGLMPLLASLQQAKFLRKLLPGDRVTVSATVVGEDGAKAKLLCRTELRGGDGELAATATATIAMR